MMAHYAFLDHNNIVTEVIVGIDENETIQGLHPEIWYSNFRGQPCKRTSYNSYHGFNKNGEPGFRKNYASIGSSYNPIRDAFIPPKPFPSFILNEETCDWVAPVAEPEKQEGLANIWDEITKSWVQVPIQD
jgi:hypothetical protein